MRAPLPNRRTIRPGVREQIVGIVRRAEDLIVALQVAGIDRQISLAEDNRSRLPQARDWPRILLRDVSRTVRALPRWCACLRSEKNP